MITDSKDTDKGTLIISLEKNSYVSGEKIKGKLELFLKKQVQSSVI